MHKIYLILLLLLATSLLAKDSIEAIGYGNTENQALKSAYKNAVEEYVGVLVDTKVVIKNSKLIENKILTFSNGYIDSYKKISSKEQMGLWEVKIKATVKEQLIAEKMEMLKIPPKNIENSEQIYAKLATQIKTKFDAEDMLIDFVKKYSTKEVYQELVSLKIDSFTLDIDSATRTEVPAEINYSYIFNYKKYNEIAKNLEILLDAIGGKKIKSYLVEDSRMHHGYVKGLDTKLSNKIGVVTLNKNNKRILNLWVFPKSYKMIYPMRYNTWNSIMSYPFENAIFSQYEYKIDISILNKNDTIEWINDGYFTKRQTSSKIFNIFEKISSYYFGEIIPPNKQDSVLAVLSIPKTGILKGETVKLKLPISKLKDMKNILINFNYTKSTNWRW